MNMFQSLKQKVTHVIPEYEIIRDFMTKNQHHTPDIAELESNQYTPLFVPDECMTSLRRHDLVKNGASGFYPFGGGYTAAEFSFLCKKTAALVGGQLQRQTTPIPLKSLELQDDLPMWMTEKYRIKGEVYALRGCSFIELDKYKQNGVVFERVTVNVNIPYFKRFKHVTQTYNGLWSATYDRSKDHIATVPCQMYIGREQYWLDQLKNTDQFFDFEQVLVSEVDRVWIKKFFDYKNHHR